MAPAPDTAVRAGDHPSAPASDVASGAGEAALWDLENLRAARGLGDWMFEQFAGAVRGRVVEVGAGIGTYSERILASEGVDRVLLIEPEPACAAALERQFGSDPRVELSRDQLPDAPALAAWTGQADLVVSLNVLEHIADDCAAVAAMAGALAPGGQLTLLVPAGRWLYGELDRAYGHHRRYTRTRLRELVEAAGLEVLDLYSFNLLGVAGWLVQKRRGAPRISARSMALYERLLRVWRPIERRVRPPFGLSVVVHARRFDR